MWFISRLKSWQSHNIKITIFLSLWFYVWLLPGIQEVWWCSVSISYFVRNPALSLVPKLRTIIVIIPVFISLWRQHWLQQQQVLTLATHSSAWLPSTALDLLNCCSSWPRARRLPALWCRRVVWGPGGGGGAEAGSRQQGSVWSHYSSIRIKI